MKLIKPKLLKKGDKIALISPAGFVTEEKLNKAIKNITDLGFEVYFKDSVLDKKAYLAGNDTDRAAELNLMFADKTVKAIMCARGGYGSTRILNLLDYKNIRKNPKIFIGYSDITALNFAILKKSGLISYHGIAGVSEFNEYTTALFNKLLVNNHEIKTIHSFTENSNKEEFLPFTINKGTAKGHLIGGNLSLISSLIGTKHFINLKNKLVFIEEINEPPYKIDRMLTHLLNATDIRKASGIIFGVFNKCNYDSFNIKKAHTHSISEVIRDFATNIKVPVSYGFSFGHINSQAIIPFGQDAIFDTEKFELKILL